MRWKGKTRWQSETEARYNAKQFCSNECRSVALAKQKPEDNYFYGKNQTPWNKGKRKDVWRIKCNQYIKLFYKDGSWEYEHRKVARDKYGEIKGLVVHHINLNGLDNSPDNLEVMTAGEHKKLHMSLI